MSYPVPANAPQITIAGRTICAAAFQWDSFVPMFRIGIYELSPAGVWMELSVLGQYTNDGELLKHIQAEGGSVKFLQFLIAKINASLAKLFGSVAVAPSKEPTTEAEARAWATGAFANLKITVVNGVPVLG